jgi:hypothetical protein
MFEKYRKVVYYVSAVLIFLIIICCAFSFNNKPAPVDNTPIPTVEATLVINTVVVPTNVATIAIPTMIPTNIPEPTQLSVGVNSAQYVVKLSDWSSRMQIVFGTLQDIHAGKVVTNDALTNVAVDMVNVQSEVHDTIPPVEYSEVHKHFQAGIDFDVEALSVAKRNPTKANELFKQGNVELTKSLEAFRAVQ